MYHTSFLVLLHSAFVLSQRVPSWPQDDHRHCASLLAIHRHCASLLADHRQCASLADHRHCASLLVDHRQCASLLADHCHCASYWLFQNEYFEGFKQAHRRDDDISIVNAGMRVLFEEGSNVIKELTLAYGGMAPITIMAASTMKQLVGRYALCICCQCSAQVPDAR